MEDTRKYNIRFADQLFFATLAIKANQKTADEQGFFSAVQQLQRRASSAMSWDYNFGHQR